MGNFYFDSKVVANADFRMNNDTVKDNNLFGVMQTTWHTLSDDMDKLLPFAKHFGAFIPPWEKDCPSQAVIASLLRRVTYEKLDYLSTGWIEKQIKRSL